MDCSFCGSQSTTYKSGISKSGKNAGKHWEGYDCNEPQCKNEKGYPNRTFAPRKKAPMGNSAVGFGGVSPTPIPIAFPAKGISIDLIYAEILEVRKKLEMVLQSMGMDYTSAPKTKKPFIYQSSEEENSPF